MLVLCASVEIGTAGERGFAPVFRCGEVPGCFLMQCETVQDRLISITPCVHL